MARTRRRFGNPCLFGLAIFAFTVFLYIFLQLQLPNEGDGIELQREEILRLEQRLTHLDVGISRSRETIARMRQSMQSLAQQSNELFLQNINNQQQHAADNETNNNVMSPLERAFTSRSNHQFLPMKSVSLFSPMPSISSEFFVQLTSSSSDAECDFTTKQSPNTTTDINMLEMYNLMPFDDADGGVWKQGFDITVPPGKWTADNQLLVFIVPHSHNDPGWLKTFEQYYKDSTKNILSLVTANLRRHPELSFIWAEMSYLSMWWNDVGVNGRKVLRTLVDDGRLELVTGGWVMTDEATAHYSAMIDQMIEGHEWIRVNLEPAVSLRSSWAIDSFGLSPTMAFILNRMGLKHVVIQRVHYAVKKQLAREKSLEFYWRQQFDVNNRRQSLDSDILCHIMPFYSYDVPHTCGPDPAVCCQFDFRRLASVNDKPRMTCPWHHDPQPIHDDNVEQRATLLVDQYKKKAELYQSNVLLVPLGDDFRWSGEGEWAAQALNYKALMKHVNSRPEQYNTLIKWGTLNDYFEALERGMNVENVHERVALPTLSGDFFTYSDRADHYWSGFYTSRPFYKRTARVMESRLRAAELAFAWLMTRIHSNEKLLKVPRAYDLLNSLFTQLVLARRSMGLFQHHDAIAGTSKTPVHVDYGNKLVAAINSCHHIIQTSLAITLLTSHYNKNSKNADAVGGGERQVVEYVSSNPSVLLLKSCDTFTKHDALPMKDSLMLSDDSGQAPRPVQAPASANVKKKKERRRRVLVYNSLATERSEVVRIRVSWPYVRLTTSAGDASPLSRHIPCQISPVFEPETNDEAVMTEYELAFLAHVPAYGARAYDVIAVDMNDAVRLQQQQQQIICSVPRIILIKPSSPNRSNNSVVQNGPFHIETLSIEEATKRMSHSDDADLLTLETSFLRATLSAASGTLTSVVQKQTTALQQQQHHSINISFISYTARTGPQRSGAYVFLPNAKPEPFSPNFVMLRLIKGALFSESLVVKHQQRLHQFVRLYNSPGVDGQSVEVVNHVDMSEAELDNRELVMQIDTDVRNLFTRTDNKKQILKQPSMFTDLNGFQMIRRVTMLDKLPIQANFFPMASAAFIQDADAGGDNNASRRRLNILASQPAGVATLSAGQIQIVLDRRLAQDDNRGLLQSVQDNKAETASRFKILFEKFSSNARQTADTDKYNSYLTLTSHHASLSLLHPLLVYFFTDGTTAENNDPRSKTKPDFAGGAKLMQPYLAMPLEDDGDSQSSSSSSVFSALSQSLPCDIHLLNIRTEVAVEHDGRTFEPAPHALMLLHRFGADCSHNNNMPIRGVKCSANASNNNNGSLNLSAIFADFSHNSWTLIEHKNLSPLHAGRALNATQAAPIQPMDIHCYRVPLGVALASHNNDQ